MHDTTKNWKVAQLDRIERLGRDIPVREHLGIRSFGINGFVRGDDGTLINDTGCGNTLDFAKPCVRRLMIDSLVHFVRHCGIDGFRFDLATVMGRTASGFTPHAPLLSAIEQDPLLSRLIMIAEPWDVGPGGYQLGAFPARWQEWNDRYRDEVRRFGLDSGKRSRLIQAGADLIVPDFSQWRRLLELLRIEGQRP